MNHETQTEIKSATVTSVVPYTDTPELRAYSVDTIHELGHVLMDINDPQVAEMVVNVEIEDGRVNVD